MRKDYKIAEEYSNAKFHRSSLNEYPTPLWVIMGSVSGSIF
jgi:hypothetical protein